MKDRILKAALDIADKRGGLEQITRERVAVKAKCSLGIVSHHFGNMAGLRTAVIVAAINSERLLIVAQAIVAGDKEVRNLDAKLKLKALAAL